MKDAPEIKEASELVQKFSELMKNRRAGELKSWLAKAEQSKISELVGFVNGIKQDFAAIEAAFFPANGVTVRRKDKSIA